MLSNLAVSVLDKERVTTTLAKAKEVRGVVERLITYGKKGDLHARRLAATRVNDEAVLKKLFDDIAPGYKDRAGGYTRVLKTEDRKGDNAPMAIIELMGRGHNDPVRKRAPKKKSPARKPVTAKTVPASEAAPEAAPPAAPQAAQETIEDTAAAPETQAAETDKESSDK
jgi:large subunit ribosomal protein L17